MLCDMRWLINQYSILEWHNSGNISQIAVSQEFCIINNHMRMRLKDLTFKGAFRDYQQRVLDESKTYLEDGKINIVAAPGSGKTILGLELLCRLGKSALVLVPSITIRQQWGDRFAEEFLPEGQKLADYYSCQISKPKDITCITYQALYAAMSGVLNKEEETEEGRGKKDNSDRLAAIKVDVAEILRKSHISTICLDEAHHLRTEWHRSVMTLIESLGKSVTIISLTATPPYDSTPAEWNKYVDLCGTIDAEISIPELVHQKTLCPHQDFVCFSFPTKEERNKIRELKAASTEAAQNILSDPIWKETYSSFENNLYWKDEDYLYAHIEEIRGFLYCVQKHGIELPKKLKKLQAERKKTVLFSKKSVEVGCQFVVDHPEYFGEETSVKMFDYFRARHLTERKRINLSDNKKMAVLLASSIGKLNGIRTITRKETENLGDELRMVILTDYIRQTWMSSMGGTEPITEMGAVPILECLRRENIPGARLGALTGAVIILPNSVRNQLMKMAKQEKYMIRFSAIKGTNFSSVEFSGGNKEKVNMVTALFQSGAINVLIGTKALLGEGWDCPCINTLILASFVGSFMQSNQMRGRAIRTDSEQPDKVANIWHLITPDIDAFRDSVPGIILEGKAAYEKSLILGEDFEMISRRFDCFMAPSRKEDVIQSGIERLDILAFMSRSDIERTNQEMLLLSENRQDIRSSWERCFARCSGGKPEVCQTTEIRTTGLPTKIGYVNLSAQLFLMIAVAVLNHLIFKMILQLGGLNTLMNILVTAGVYCLLLRTVIYTIRMLSPVRMIEAVAKATHAVLCENRLIRSKDTSVGVAGDAEGIRISCVLRGGTLHEKQIFGEAIQEMLSPMNHPRYIVLKRTLRVPHYYFSFSCPSLVGNNKENAELFQKELRQRMGELSVVYTRNETGHKIYRKCVKHSFVNYEENAAGCLVRKEVY